MNSWSVKSIRIALVIILAALPKVYLQSQEDKIVSNCIAETHRFTQTEDQYVDRRPKIEGVPSPVGSHFKFVQREAYVKEKRQRPFECISKHKQNNSKLNFEESSEFQKLMSKCLDEQPKQSCNSDYKFRSYDGTCNNLANWKWGSLFNCLRRLFPANYEGVSGLRQSVCGKPLPEPRSISLNVHQDRNKTNEKLTHMLTFFGQFLAHDTSDVAPSFIDDKTIDCCSTRPVPDHPQCISILMKEDDHYYSKVNVTCLDLTRAVPCDTCSLGKRVQMNQQTSYLDLSAIYGLNEERARNLRSDKIKLKIQQKEVGDLMPADYKKGFCGDEDEREYCFLSGDRRVNQHTLLITIHTLFVREHNRIAAELKRLNPECPDEYIFQYARSINIAQFQVIIYKEFLPLLLGPDLMSRYGLWIGEEGKSTYNSYEDATLFVEFSIAAYRLHSLLNGLLTSYGTEGETNMPLRHIFGEVGEVYQEELSSVMNEIFMSPLQKYDRFLTEDMTDNMYKEKHEIYGFDIASINVQRGRDVGLPTYTEVVSYLSNGGIDIKNFNELDVLMEDENINILKKVYCDVKDIDLWVGMNNERVRSNMLVGPTAGEIIALQFRSLKEGDRFYFEHSENKLFDLIHLETLRTVTLSSLLCLNTEIESIPINAFLFSNEKNPRVSCDVIPKLNLAHFEVEDILGSIVKNTLMKIKKIITLN